MPMKPKLLSDIPGLKEAVRIAEAVDAAPRMLPFLGCDLEIAGIAVKQFTPRHFLYLDVGRSPFIHGGSVTAEALAQFLWVVSPEFRPGDRVCRDVFVAEIEQLPYEAALEGVHAYLDQAYQDAPSGRASSSSPPTYCVATMIDHLFAHGYGALGRDGILDMPFAEIFQYQRRIHLREEPDHKFSSPAADAAKRKAVRDYIAEQAGQTKEAARG